MSAADLIWTATILVIFAIALWRWRAAIRDLFPPLGFTLIRQDGKRHNRLRGDMVPADSLVIFEDNRTFVRTGKKDDAGFLVFREGYRTTHYESPNA